MQKPVVITSDSTCDLSQELLDRFKIPIIRLTITLGDDTFLDGEGFTPLDMYARYRQDGTLPKTSAPGVQEFLDFFSPFVRLSILISARNCQTLITRPAWRRKNWAASMWLTHGCCQRASACLLSKGPNAATAE